MKDKTFDYYLQEALKELEKPCEEFNSARCEWLLTRCCGVLLEGSDNLDKFMKKNNDENVESNPINGSQDSFGERDFPFCSSVVLEVEDVEKSHGEALKYPKCCRDCFGILLPFPVFSSLGSHECSPCGLPQTGRGLYGEKDKLSKAGNSRVQGCSGKENIEARVSNPLHSDSSQKQVFSECYRGNSERAKKYLAVIDNSTGKTVQIPPTEDPAEALAEALSKLTPGVKTIVWRAE